MGFFGDRLVNASNPLFKFAEQGCSAALFHLYSAVTVVMWSRAAAKT
jgi:hypothetical protein